MTYAQMIEVIRTYQGNKEALARYLSALGAGRLESCRGYVLRYSAKAHAAQRTH